ncbi:pyridoxamine 5'-phosphate oxidase family protein [Roseovarius sp. LXJ103]|uniref:pyridoxamine 5'-phosphate oxidase family protein n=1 Tax=Roseovarius carneus TaxID=2853164 RepID=UPI000D60FF1A|nr:pyridoxamine 5'-phosphate oxidase family protein [Roseovarius carneus]MBZ8118294.1 pyridoxamine 5'-phosphate oxidase family protein [Roseovarius carneus]PWE35984.1 pyridoxamine 5'-phosphate oxidase [Pelagicola sp. LXJ1103]
MDYVEDIAELEALYGTPSAPALRKVAPHLTPLYRKWIMASRFCILTTVGPGGTDGSPRGEDGPVVTELDPQTLAMPDWRGNNRMDSLRNIVADGRVSLMFMVPGSDTVVRVNGEARVTVDGALRARFEVSGKQPRSVIVIRIGEVYTQCARAPMRAGLWSRDDSAGLPTVGEILAEASNGDEGGAAYDDAWAARAAGTMW